MRVTMIARIAAVLALGVGLAASPLNAQGVAKKQGEVSSAVLRAMTLQKQRSKKSMIERVGVKRATLPASSSVRGRMQPAPTSVREIAPASKRK